MSVQLILYPQSYDGVPNAFSAANQQMIANGTDFSGLTSNKTSYAASTTLAQTAVNTLINTMASNTWYGFYSSSVSSAISGSANTSTYIGYAGAIQRLTNMTASAVYDVSLTWHSAYADAVTIRVYQGVNLVSSTVATPDANDEATVQFTAPSANNTTFVIDYANVSANAMITSVSIQMASAQPSGAIQLLNNGQVICDLYEDEDIPLSLSVDDFKNVAEKVQSYSKAFNLPATKRNNRIFDQMYEITRSDDGVIFNPYVKTKCELKQDGFLLFEGYMRMIDVTDKQGEISYNVNLYSEVVALADVLKDRTFSDLDFTELTHDYNITQIKLSWNSGTTGITYTNPSTSGFRDAYSTVKYPFCDWNHQYTVNSIGNPDLPNLESAFRPFINLKYCIDRIFNAPDTPFSYTSVFLNSIEFTNLYMDFNWGSDNSPALTNATQYNSYFFFGAAPIPEVSNYATTSYSVLHLTEVSQFGISLMPPNYNASTNIITSTVVNENYLVSYSYTIKNTDTVSRTIECQWLYNSTVKNYSSVQTIPAGATYTYSGNLSQTMATVGDTLQAQFKTNAGTANKVRQLQSVFPSSTSASVVWNVNIIAITTNTFLQTLRGELGQWEFLKGIMTMFNLVTLVDPDNPNNLLIETYADIFTGTGIGTTLFNRGIVHDWTDKIDVSQMKLEPLTDLNKKTIFKFVEDDDDFCFMEYKRQVRHLYGSKKYDASAFTVLEGTDEIIAEPFAATIPAPLMPQYADFIVPKIYASDDGTENEGFDNSPRIMYNNGIHDLSSCTYHIPSQNGVTFISAEDQYLRFSHLSEIPTATGSTSDFHFGECQLSLPIGDSVPQNLFNCYWLPYYSQLYNPNTRTMTLKINLNAGDISTFQFYDKVFIKNRTFRVNKIDYKPNDLATVEFILIQ